MCINPIGPRDLFSPTLQKNIGHRTPKIKLHYIKETLDAVVKEGNSSIHLHVKYGGVQSQPITLVEQSDCLGLSLLSSPLHLSNINFLCFMSEYCM